MISVIPNWKLVIKKSWSAWLILAATLLSGLEATFSWLPPGWTPPGVSPGSLAMASATISGLAYFARFLAQKSLHPDEEA